MIKFASVKRSNVGSSKNENANDMFLQKAQNYLRDNAELRIALGICKGAILVPHYLGQGEHNKNFRFKDPNSGREFVLRINVASQPFHKNQVAYEFAALKALEQSGCVPKALYLDDSKRLLNEGALVISFCEGKQLDFDNLQAGDLQCAIQMMANIHAVPTNEESNPHVAKLFKPKDPLEELYAECVSRFKIYQTSGFEDARITKWAQRFFNIAKPQLETRASSSNASHIINTETLPSHFLIPKNAANEAATNASKAGTFCSAPGTFVDWERPIIGEVAQDLAYFISPTTTFWDSDFLFPASEIEAVINDYWRAVDGRFEQGNFEERFYAFRTMTVLRSMTWCCKALVQYSAQSTQHKTAKTAGKLPIYLSDEFLEQVIDTFEA